MAYVRQGVRHYSATVISVHTPHFAEHIVVCLEQNAVAGRTYGAYPCKGDLRPATWFKGVCRLPRATDTPL